MTDIISTSLLDAIAEFPDDDTPRLVYADWLDEQEPVRMTCPKCVDKTGFCWGKVAGCPYCDDNSGSLLDTSNAEIIPAKKRKRVKK